MKVRDLIEKLSEYDLDATILATWEGQVTYFDIYNIEDGTVLIDTDSNDYKQRFIDGDPWLIRKVESLRE
jgi:hypothetical protein